jgi:hypothetical protein
MHAHRYALMRIALMHCMCAPPPAVPLLLVGPCLRIGVHRYGVVVVIEGYTYPSQRVCASGEPLSMVFERM